jgi:hypothetical protein
MDGIKRVGSHIQRTGKFSQYASMVKLSNIKHHEHVFQDYVEQLWSIEPVIGTVLSVRQEEKPSRRRDGTKTVTLEVQLKDNRKHMALLQYFSGYVDEDDEFMDTDKSNPRRMRPTMKAMLCMFTDEHDNQDKRAVEYKYAFELVNRGIHVQVYDRSRDSTEDFTAHLAAIPKKCPESQIQSCARAFGTSLGTRHTFVTLSANSNLNTMASAPPVANLIDLDIQEPTAQQSAANDITTEQQVMLPEIITAFETAVTTARAPVVNRMLSAIEDKMLGEFRAKMDQLANNTMLSMLRFDQTTEELAKKAQEDLHMELKQ